MKRSQLIKQIDRYLQQDLNIDMEPEWVEEILNIVEKAGMLPPKCDYVPYVAHDWDFDYDAYCQAKDSDGFGYQWEPEDE